VAIAVNKVLVDRLFFPLGTPWPSYDERRSIAIIDPTNSTRAYATGISRSTSQSKYSLAKSNPVQDEGLWVALHWLPPDFFAMARRAAFLL